MEPELGRPGHPHRQHPGQRLGGQGHSGDVWGDVATNHSRIELTAGAQSGDITLTGWQGNTLGDMVLTAVEGAVTQSGSELVADRLIITAKRGVAAVVDVGHLDMAVTGAGDITVLSTGNLEVGDVIASDGATGNITLTNTEDATDGRKNLTVADVTTGAGTVSLTSDKDVVVKHAGGTTVRVTSSTGNVTVRAPASGHAIDATFSSSTPPSPTTPWSPGASASSCCPAATSR